MDKRLIAVTWLTFAMAAAAAPIGPNLFIADNAFTIEKAVADAAAQRTPQDPPTWKLLVADSEAQRVLASRVTPATTEIIRKARASGATVFICARELKALNATPRDLIPGVHAVRGYLSAESRVPDWERRLPWAPDRKAIAVCGSD
jgi:intracellular sulfur oxidation DsrE/DsrF family protein